MDFTRCRGCKYAPSILDLDARAKERHRLSTDAAQRLDLLKSLLLDTDNWEDLGQIHGEIEDLQRQLDLLSLIEDYLRTYDPSNVATAKYWGAIASVQDTLPGAKDLLQFQARAHRRTVAGFRCGISDWDPNELGFRIWETGYGSNTGVSSHELSLDDHMALAAHWEMLRPAGPDGRVLLGVGRLTVYHISMLGIMFAIDPSVFIRHLWRQSEIEAESYGLPFIQSPAAGLNGLATLLENHPKIEHSAHPSATSRMRCSAFHTYQSSQDYLVQRHWATTEGQKWRAAGLDAIRTEVRRQAEFAPISSISPPLIISPPEYQDRCALALGDFLSQVSFHSFDSSARFPSEVGLILDNCRLSIDDMDWMLQRGAPNLTSTERSTFMSWASKHLSLLMEHCLTSSVTDSATRLSLTQCLGVIELFWTRDLVAEIQLLLNTDVAALRYSFPSDDHFHDVAASRLTTRRVFLDGVKESIRKLKILGLKDLPGRLKLEAGSVSTETLQLTGLLASKLDALDCANTQMKDAQFRKLQIELTQTQIRESRVAIKQADTVARLTILAFVYIPTASVCGIFGMNIVERPNGFPLWMFGLTLAVVLTTTLLLAFANPISALLNKYWFDLHLHFNEDIVVYRPLQAMRATWNHQSLLRRFAGSAIVLVRLPIWLFRVLLARIRARVREGHELRDVEKRVLEDKIQSRVRERRGSKRWVADVMRQFWYRNV